MGYSLLDSAAMPSSHIHLEFTDQREDGDEYVAPEMLRRSKRVPHAPDCGTGHRLDRSLLDSAAMPSSHVHLEFTDQREDGDEYVAPEMLRRSKRVPHAPDCGTGHRLDRR
ncbi:hypothetical protein F511_09507 [Dorcoceras hygrometricum]|uniref:Uncharacterized protein n=1 Tax=Dorcoceras hygrometricum TaxID=472368 RepID=A0A2Z7AVX7_9LAMI|nr:hypothetical protein F511_09507 [Dorcoceras hygrometricum]